VTVIWATVLTVLIISLIYWEQTAVLYILATLGVAALLAVVAYADLGSAEKVSPDRINRDD
jgi:hypothetical protein